jgi:Xaa-Pro aminopeptidase
VDNPKPIFDAGRLRRLMERDGLDLILASSRVNVGYLSNWLTHSWTWEWPFWFEVEKEYDGWDYLLFTGIPVNPDKTPFFVTFYHHAASVRQKSWIDDIKGAGRPGLTPRPGLKSVFLEPSVMITHVDCVVAAVKERGLEEGTIGIELSRMAQSVYAELRERLPKAKFIDSFEMLLELRAVKLPAEIAKLRRAADITTKAFDEVIFPLLRDHATPYEIYERALALAAKERGYFAFLHMFVDGGHVGMAGSNRETATYNVPPDVRLKDGQIAFVDFGCGYGGYWGDMCRTVVIGGKPTSAQRQAHAAIIDARRAIRDAVRPGVKPSSLFKIGLAALDKYDLGPALSFMGHGIGLSIHENPCLTAFDDRPIEAGMVISIEPQTEVPGLTMFQAEDSIVVTEDGYEDFTDLPTHLDILAPQ